ncbi:rna polymerase sigma-70 region 2 [Lucifera butyrica]|uniref:Rna polymerase sigma-70 region 2 n=1 Tax=Lucifera butyrica TaxID=1351585 RepID=A0A498R4R9_9FIRM|nr:sigma-70 family RNA polymerase sigma factor [Lucifera butyrica]VBB06441.1 rna polymerase sigma-70 region 2 [Lucifera butyrica]
MADDKMEFEQMYTSFRPTIYRYLTRLVGMQEAEDLTQEVFIKVEKALPTFRQEAQLSTWLYRIATHVAIDRMRQPSFRRELTSEQAAGTAAEPTGTKAGVAADTCSLEEQVGHRETSTVSAR